MNGPIDQLAAQRRHSCLEQARQERQAGRLRALRRAARRERTAERRLIQAWRRAADLRARLEFLGADQPPVGPQPPE